MHDFTRPRLPATRGSAAAIGLAFFLLVPPAPRAETGLVPGHDPELQHVFGGQTVSVSVPFEAIEEPHAPGVSSRIGRWVRTQLVQRTSGITAPVGRPHEHMLGRGPTAGRAQIDVDLPRVSRETIFELVVESRAAAGGEWRPARAIALRAYPKDLLGPIRTMAGKRRIRVVEDRGQPRLAAFLSRVDIGFESPGATPRPGADPAITLYAGEAAQVDPSEHQEPGAAIYFTERDSGLPHIVVERNESGGSATVMVAMSLLDRLETDPEAQQTFLKIFELVEAEADPR